MGWRRGAPAPRAGLATIGGVLLPPYPSGFFRHPILREQFTYQNGGQWDWWAGRFSSRSSSAGTPLRPAASWRARGPRRRARGGLYEWNTREGQGQGSPRYAGSAGALGRRDLHRPLRRRSRAPTAWPSTSGSAELGPRARASSPPAARHVSYEYSCDPGRRRLSAPLRGEPPRPRHGRGPAAAGTDGGARPPRRRRGAPAGPPHRRRRLLRRAWRPTGPPTGWRSRSGEPCPHRGPGPRLRLDPHRHRRPRRRPAPAPPRTPSLPFAAGERLTLR